MICLIMGISCTRQSFAGKYIEQSQFLLDTVTTIKIYNYRDEKLLTDAFGRIAAFEKELSRYHFESDVSKINNADAGTLVKTGSNVIQILSTAIRYAEISGGAFDPSIGPLVDLWGFGRKNPQIPSAQELKRVLPLVNFREIHINSETEEAGFNKPEMRLDLGGITKGWIADEIARYLIDNGAEHFIIDLGGNVRLAGGKPDGASFVIGLQDPFNDRGSYMGLLTLKEGSIITSGVYERYFEIDGIRYHHILDTKTGYPVENMLASVTIISPYSMDGDALSTAIFALGLQAGLEMVMNLKDIEAVFITRQKNIIVTPAIASSFEAEEGISVQVHSERE